MQGNPRVYKALRDQFAAVLDELRRIEDGQGAVSYTHLDVYKRQAQYGKPGDLVAGANIAGFLKVADSMLAYGLV